jgi:hypothetical protein
MNIEDIKHFKLDEMKTLVDVETAKKLLGNNEDNRRFRKNTTKKYARQMELGRWSASPEPLVITDKGRAVSLQHRLQALIETGKPQEFTICVIKDEDFDRIFQIVDQAAPRSLSDALDIDPKIIKPINYLLRCCGIKDVMAEDLEPYADSELGRICSVIDIHKTSGKLWRNNCFRAAMAVAILSKAISEEDAFSIYETLNKNLPNEWPHIFAALYIQLTDPSKPLHQSGRSFKNDWFIRSLYAFDHYKSNTRTIRIGKSYMREAETRVLAIMQTINPNFLD